MQMSVLRGLVVMTMPHFYYLARSSLENRRHAYLAVNEAARIRRSRARIRRPLASANPSYIRRTTSQSGVSNARAKD
jgi:hypothetical protein